MTAPGRMRGAWLCLVLAAMIAGLTSDAWSQDGSGAPVASPEAPAPQPAPLPPTVDVPEGSATPAAPADAPATEQEPAATGTNPRPAELATIRVVLSLRGQQLRETESGADALARHVREHAEERIRALQPFARGNLGSDRDAASHFGVPVATLQSASGLEALLLRARATEAARGTGAANASAVINWLRPWPAASLQQAATSLGLTVGTSPSPHLGIAALQLVLAFEAQELLAEARSFRDEEAYAARNAQLDVAWVEARQRTLRERPETAELPSGSDELRTQISAARERLSAETTRTDRLEAEAEASRRAATEARERAETEIEREAAAEIERRSEELSRVARERRQAEAQQETITEAREGFLRQQSEFLARVQAIRATDVPLEREALSAEFLVTITEQRGEVRTQAVAVRERLDAFTPELESATRRVTAAASAVELARTETGADNGRIQVLRQESLNLGLEVAELELELVQWNQDIAYETWALHRQQVFFLARLSDRLVPLMSAEDRRNRFRLSGDNLRLERDNYRDRYVGLSLLTQDRLARLTDLGSWLFTIDGVLRVSRLLMASFLLIGALALLTRWRVPILERVYEAIRTRRFVRRNQPYVLKALELLRDTLRALTLYFAVDLLIGDVSSDGLEELQALQRFLKQLMLYFVVMQLARTLLLPRQLRGLDGTNPSQLATFGVDVLAIEGTTAELLIRTLRVWMLYGLATGLASDLLHVVLGESLTSFVFDRTVFLVRLGLVYAMLWWWRDVIVDSALRLTGLQDHPNGQRLLRHKDRPYSVLFLAVLAAYVLLRRTTTVVVTWARTTTWVKQAQNFLYRKKVERTQAEQSRTSAHDVAVSQEAPERYRCLFDPRQPATAAQLVPRPLLRARLLGLHDRWMAREVPSGAAIIAEWGMGKTTFLDRWADDLPASTRLHRARMDRRIIDPAEILAWVAQTLALPDDCRTEAQIVAALAADPGRVVVLEDCEQSYLRTINGFRAVDALFRLVSMTNRTCYWVLVFDLHAWRFLNRVRDRQHHFQDVLQLPPLTDEETRELIERRAAASDLEVSFRSLLDTGDSDTDGQVNDVVQTSAGFYRLLKEYAEGNPRITLHLWLKSVHMTADNRLEVRLFRRPAAKTIAELSAAQIFALTALVQHHTMRVDELGRAIGLDAEAIELDVDALHDRAILVYDPDGRVRVSTEWFRPVLQMLRDRNMTAYPGGRSGG